MRRDRFIFLVCTATAVVACATPSGPSAANLNARANQLYFQKRYLQAVQEFEAARKKAQEAGDRQYESIATFGMARANAQICELNDADMLFKEAIRLRSALPDIQYSKNTQNLVEYARFLISRNRGSEAAILMERAIPDLDASGVSNSDPIAYAMSYDDYALALKEAGRDNATAVARAARLRADNPGREADFKPTPLPARCA